MNIEIKVFKDYEHEHKKNSIHFNAMLHDVFL
ncbi:hypothetical protein EZS27_030927 [termite gut metagenome]|uniref:Uncharacterized protein n=1 Tax=termite gut metagenome TaxID=433724 RepID=A0A5J4QDS8_9ZZZZ